MKIVSEKDLNQSRDEIVTKSFKACQSAEFPVDELDVYNHLYGNDKLVQRFLLNEDNEIVGFGVAQQYDLEDETLAYLHGMVIAREYQGKGYSKELLESIYQYFQSDLYGLRTQNPKMALSMLNLFKSTLLEIPVREGKKTSEKDVKSLIKLVRTVEPYKYIDDNGVIKNCYHNQLYPDLSELKKINQDIDLDETDALAVIVRPTKKLSLRL